MKEDTSIGFPRMAASRRLSRAKARTTVPNNSPDRKFIYFHSSHGGLNQIWRKKPDGSDEEQVTPDDGYDNSYQRLSPDGQRMSFFSSEKSVTGHPENRDVMLRMMNLATRQITVLAKLLGAQVNRSTWSPDGRRLAFVSYQVIR